MTLPASGWPGRRLVLAVPKFSTWLADVSVAADREKGVRLLIDSRLSIPCEMPMLATGGEIISMHPCILYW